MAKFSFNFSARNRAEALNLAGRQQTALNNVPGSGRIVNLVTEAISAMADQNSPIAATVEGDSGPDGLTLNVRVGHPDKLAEPINEAGSTQEPYRGTGRARATADERNSEI